MSGYYNLVKTFKAPLTHLKNVVSSAISKKGKVSPTITKVEPSVAKTKKQKLVSELKKTTQRVKSATARLKQTQFERANPKFKGEDFTFATRVGRSSKVREKQMGGGMMGRRMGYSQGKLAVTPREKQLAAQYGDKKRITRGDVITAAKKKGKA